MSDGTWKGVQRDQHGCGHCGLDIRIHGGGGGKEEGKICCLKKKKAKKKKKKKNKENEFYNDVF